MFKRAIAGTVLAVFAGASYAQTADQRLQFEVASVKESPPRKEGAPRGTVGCSGGPGSRDPGQFTCTNASISLMVVDAYGLKPYQVRPPYSEDNSRFNIVAKAPPGTTAAQIKLMLRNLLAERLKLAFHYEKTEVPGYALVVAKSGLKMKESAPAIPPAPAENAAPPPKPGPFTDADGFAYFVPMRGYMAIARANGLTRWVGSAVPTDRLAQLAGSLVGRPAIDSTGLKGQYDISLTFSSETIGEPGSPDEAGLTVFAALEKQLGLKLENTKIVFDAFVIDNVDKTPIEN
jgi:uncharacterized protein (TIGR03435 family)